MESLIGRLLPLNCSWPSDNLASYHEGEMSKACVFLAANDLLLSAQAMM